MVWQAHEPQRVDEGGVRGEIADAGAGESERLAHGARDDEALTTGQQRQGRALVVRGELEVRLVDDDDAVARLVHRLDDVEPERGARRIIRRAQEDHIGRGIGDLGCRVFGVDRVAGRSGSRDPLGTGAAGEQRVHGVCGRESEGGATGPREGLKDVLQHLVRAVRGPDLVAREAVAEIVREAFAQRGELAVGVPVDVAQRESDRVEDVVGDLGGNRMRVLVDVEGDRKRCLRGTVGLLPPEIGAYGEVFETCTHPSHGRPAGHDPPAA